MTRLRYVIAAAVAFAVALGIGLLFTAHTAADGGPAWVAVVTS